MAQLRALTTSRADPASGTPPSIATSQLVTPSSKPSTAAKSKSLLHAEQRFAATLPPLEALRAWMLLFIDHVAAKTLIIPAMDTVAGGSMRLIEGSRSLIHTAFVTSVKRAIASGELRADTDPNDFVRALVGVFHTTALPGWEQSARRLVNILIAGSRPTS